MASSSLVSSTKHFYVFRFSPMRATYPTHLMFLQLIVLATADEKYQSHDTP